MRTYPEITIDPDEVREIHTLERPSGEMYHPSPAALKRGIELAGRGAGFRVAAQRRAPVSVQLSGDSSQGRKGEKQQHNLCFECVHKVSFLGQSEESVQAVSGGPAALGQTDLQAVEFGKM